ncbi:MAG: AAA family ATPase, partial [Pyrodictiaceae archaeon]
MDSRIKVAAELLLYSGKSVLLAGAPGTGKTKLGFELAREFTGIDPLSIVGRGDLASRDLLYSYEPHATGFRLVLGELSLSILASWIRLLKGLTPRWLLLDELNRMNAEIVLGSLFTALDIAHRDRIAVVPSWLVKHVLGDNELLAEVARAADVDKDAAKKLLREVIEASSQQGLSGLPLPYSWRAIATINLLDRSHLFGLGFALLRRFPIVLFPELGGDFQPRIEPQAVEDKHEMYKNNKIYKRVYNLFDGADSVCVKALKE